MRVSPAQMVPTRESGPRKWGTAREHGEIWSVLSGQDPNLLDPGPVIPYMGRVQMVIACTEPP